MSENCNTWDFPIRGFQQQAERAVGDGGTISQMLQKLLHEDQLTQMPPGNTPWNISGVGAANYDEFSSGVYCDIAKVNDESLSVDERLFALEGVRDKDESRIDDYLYSHLLLDSPIDDWTGLVVRLIEHVQYNDLDKRKILSEKLVRVALEVSKKEDDDMEQAEAVAYSALRKATSMLEPDEFPNLLEFLDPTVSRIDMLNAALGCINNYTDVHQLGDTTVLENKVESVLSNAIGDEVWIDDVDRQSQVVYAIMILNKLDNSASSHIEGIKRSAPNWFNEYIEEEIRVRSSENI